MAGSFARLSRGLDETVAYGRMNVMRALSVSLGCLLFGIWVASVVGFRWGMELFADFKIEMHPLTLWANAATKSVWVWPLTAFVAGSSVLLALEKRFSGWLALSVCVLCLSVMAGFALSIVALGNGLTGGDDGAATSVSWQFSGIGAGVVLMVMSFALIPSVLLGLWLSHRAPRGQ